MVSFKFFLRVWLVVLALVMFSGAVVSGGNPASAQENNEVASDSPLGAVDSYVAPEYSNLAKAYWSIGKFNLNNDAAIDNFLRITECDLYNAYYHNEFEWGKIREMTRQSIQANMHKFPTQFEVMQPVYIGDYDIDKGEFAVDPESLMSSVRKIDVAYNSKESICGSKGQEIEEYPRNIMVYLNRPVVFVRLPMPRELAEVFINYADREKGRLPMDLRRKSGIRTAFLRLKVRLVQYKDTVRVAANAPVRVLVLTQLEGIEVYADAAKTQLLFRQDIATKKLRRMKRLKKEAAGENSSSPEDSQGQQGAGGDSGAPASEPAPEQAP